MVADREHNCRMKSPSADVLRVRRVLGRGTAELLAVSVGLDAKDHYLARHGPEHGTLYSLTS